MGKRSAKIQVCINGSSSESAIAINRVCLTLLRIYRNIKTELTLYSHEALGRPFWPLIAQEATELPPTDKARLCKLASRKLAGAKSNRGPEEGNTLLDILHGRIDRERGSETAFEFVGEAIARDKPVMRELLDAMEAWLARSVANTELPSDKNVRLLADMLSLNPVEAFILGLARDVELSGLGADLLGHIKSSRAMVEAVALASGTHAEHDASAALKARSRLLSSGLLANSSFNDHTSLDDLLSLSRIGSTLVSMTSQSAADMAAAILQPLAQSKAVIPLAWPHIAAKTQLLESVLAQGLAKQAKGINILIYGPSGAGKTEFARLVLDNVGANGYRIDDVDGDGDSASRPERLASLALSQIFSPAGKSVLVLDEAEDIFKEDYIFPGHSSRDSRQEISKSWMNALLENNRNPVIWITNRIHHMDPAYLRRFTFCLEFPTTPLGVRRKLAGAYLTPVGCSQVVVDLAASCADVSPAMLASTAKLIQMTATGGVLVDDTTRHVLAEQLKAIGKQLPSHVPDRATRFDMNYLNVKGNFTAAQVVDGLQRAGRGTLLCSGAPGTGKTQLAAEIARNMGRELIYKTAADINSMWYGESERNVARMFEECDVDHEVLFLDEADTLLGARESSNHRADTAVTAEFLRRVEAFKGVFVCATNHKAHLDSAMMRRFMFRLDFQPLTLAQRTSMLLECATQDASQLSAIHSLVLGKLDALTPGDFANVVKRARALQLDLSLAQWLEELQAEQASKPSVSKSSMGFV